MLQGVLLDTVGLALAACEGSLKPSRGLLDGMLRLLGGILCYSIIVKPAVASMLGLCLQAAKEQRLASPSFPAEIICDDILVPLLLQYGNCFSAACSACCCSMLTCLLVLTL